MSLFMQKVHSNFEPERKYIILLYSEQKPEKRAHICILPLFKLKEPFGSLQYQRFFKLLGKVSKENKILLNFLNIRTKYQLRKDVRKYNFFRQNIAKGNFLLLVRRFTSKQIFLTGKYLFRKKIKYHFLPKYYF